MNFVDYKGLGARVRRQRQQMKITQEQLAERMGVSHSFVGHIERGTRKASLETLVQLCRCLEISADFLLQDSVPFSNFVLSDQLDQRERSLVADLVRSMESTMLDWHAKDNLKQP